MIMLDISDTSFGQDVKGLIQPLTVVICLGIAFKIIQTLYAVATENITVDKAKIKVKQLFKVAIITVTLSEISDTIVNGYLMNGVNPNSGADVIIKKAISLLRDLLKATTGLAVSITAALYILKMLQIQKTEQPEEIAQLKKQAATIAISGVLISCCLAVTITVLGYFGFKMTQIR